MALIRTGHGLCYNIAVLRSLELTESLVNLGISSELLDSTILNMPRRIDGTLSEVTIPSNLVHDVYAQIW